MGERPPTTWRELWPWLPAEMEATEGPRLRGFIRELPDAALLTLGPTGPWTPGIDVPPAERTPNYERAADGAAIVTWLASIRVRMPRAIGELRGTLERLKRDATRLEAAESTRATRTIRRRLAATLDEALTTRCLTEPTAENARAIMRAAAETRAADLAAGKRDRIPGLNRLSGAAVTLFDAAEAKDWPAIGTAVRDVNQRLAAARIEAVPFRDPEAAGGDECELYRALWSASLVAPTWTAAGHEHFAVLVTCRAACDLPAPFLSPNGAEAWRESLLNDVPRLVRALDAALSALDGLAAAYFEGGRGTKPTVARQATDKLRTHWAGRSDWSLAAKVYDLVAHDPPTLAGLVPPVNAAIKAKAKARRRLGGEVVAERARQRTSREEAIRYIEKRLKG